MMFGSLAEVELGAVSSGAGARLQTALVALGAIVKDSTLSAVKVDGVPGAKTATAASLAFTKYVTGAPAAYKKLTAARVKTTAAALAALIEGEIRRRGGTVPPPATVIKAQIAKKVVAKAGAKIVAKKKATVKKAAAVKKAATAKQKAAMAKFNATALRKAAAKLRTNARQATPAQAAKLEAHAKALEADAGTQDRVAAGEEVTTATAAREATQAATQEAVATQAIARETAQAVAEQLPAAAPAAMPEAAATAIGPAMPTEAPSAGEGFFGRNKIALGVGAAAVVGLAVVLLKKRGLR